jgi:hypothetical protein
VVRGVVQSGGLAEVLTSDNLRLVVLPGIVFTSQQYPIVVEAKAEAPLGTEEAFSFTVETQGSSMNVIQQIALYNYQTNSFDQLDVRNLTLTDTTISADIFEGAQDYIEPVSKEVKARISFKAVGPVFVSPWQARTDLIRWSFPQ